MTTAHTPRTGWWALVFVLAAAIFAATCFGAWQLHAKARELAPVADQSDERTAATQAASTAATKLLSYSYETLEQDFSAATSLLTGDFLSYYSRFTRETVAPAARQKELVTTATVKRSGVQTLTRDAAVILLFVDQTTTTKEKPAPTEAASSVKVGLTKATGRWLVNRFDPV